MQITSGMQTSRYATPPLRTVQFGHADHSVADKKARNLKRWMVAEVLGGTLLIFSTPFVEPVVTNLLGADAHHHGAVVREAGDLHAGDEFVFGESRHDRELPPESEAPGAVEEDHHADEADHLDEEAESGGGHAGEAGKFGTAALMSGLFALFHYGWHAVSGGLFYRFGRHKAEEELVTSGRNFEGVKGLLRDKIGDTGEDYELIEQGDELIVRRKPKASNDHVA